MMISLLILLGKKVLNYSTVSFFAIHWRVRDTIDDEIVIDRIIKRSRNEDKHKKNTRSCYKVSDFNWFLFSLNWFIERWNLWRDNLEFHFNVICENSGLSGSYFTLAKTVFLSFPLNISVESWGFWIKSFQSTKKKTRRWKI
jgi:hypothetical protein